MTDKLQSVGTSEAGVGSRRERIKLCSGVALCVLAAALVALVERDGNSAETVGSALSPILLGAILAVVIRLIWSRLEGGSAFDPPGFVLCMGIVALLCSFLVLKGRARENRETIDKAIGAVESGARTCPPLELGNLAGDFSAGRPSPVEIKRYGIDLEAGAASAGEFAPIVESSDVLVVRQRNVVIGVVISIPFDFSFEEGTSEAEARVDAFKGLRDGALEQGEEAEDVTIAGEPGVSYKTPLGDYAAGTVIDCRAVITRSGDARSAVLATERLVEAQPAG